MVVRRPLVPLLEECLGAGLRALQLREKDLGVRALLALATDLREATSAWRARLIVNDRADVALAVEADGVQRTHASLPVTALRRAAGHGQLIGASVHSVPEGIDAAAEGADFLVFGPIYDTPSKRGYGPPQGLDALGRMAASVELPVLGVGGITPERARDVVACGASGVAVIGAVLAAPRPADVVKAFLDVLGRA
jgi:thiamine-phosphate pyrophosphorylase